MVDSSSWMIPRLAPLFFSVVRPVSAHPLDCGLHGIQCLRTREGRCNTPFQGIGVPPLSPPGRRRHRTHPALLGCAVWLANTFDRAKGGK